MVMHHSDALWSISVIALSVGGTFAIIYIIKHVLNYFERRIDNKRTDPSL
jgi:hypothetical protein